MRGLRYEGIYTPPSLRGTLLYPSPLGGVNWGGAALDPETGIIYANNNRLPYAVRLIARDSIEGAGAPPKQKIKNWLHDRWMNLLWLHHPVIWWVAALVLLVAMMIRRSSFNPGLAGGACVVMLLIAAAVLQKHYLAEEDAVVHAVFGLENGPNTKTPYA